MTYGFTFRNIAALNDVTRSTGFMSIVSHFIQPRRHSKLYDCEICFVLGEQSKITSRLIYDLFFHQYTHAFSRPVDIGDFSLPCSFL
jgi:hypothetical protein